MKTPDEIKKGLESCGADECHGQHTDCPYHNDALCIMHICGDALAYIQQLEKQIAFENRGNENRVMTLEEVRKHCKEGPIAYPLWTEFLEGGLSRWINAYSPPDICNISTIDRYLEVMGATYGKRWRCWLRMPTSERIANTPWEKEA